MLAAVLATDTHEARVCRSGVGLLRHAVSILCLLSGPSHMMDSIALALRDG